MTESTLTIEGVYSNLAGIGDFTEAFARETGGFDARAIYALQMAVDEACSNIIEHGYGGEGKGEIFLAFDVIEDGIKVTIQDHGQAFDPDSVPEPDVHAPIEEREEGGLGLFLMGKLMDEVKFTFGASRGETNTLVMIKRFDSQKTE